MPRAVVVTHLDQQRADFDEALAICQRVFGAGVQPLYLPLLADDEAPAGLIGLLSQQVFDYSGGARVEREADAEHLELIEGAAARADRGDHPGVRGRRPARPLARAARRSAFDTLVEDLEKAVARGAFHPVLPADAATGLGHRASCSRSSSAGFPSPLEHPAPAGLHPRRRRRASPSTCDPAGPLVAEVVKTTTDPFVGRISLVRIFSGTLVPDATVHVSGHFAQFAGEERGHQDHDVDERVGAVSVVLGATLTPVDGASPATSWPSPG